MKTVTATELAKIAMRQVRNDLIIGEGNTREAAYRTGGWSYTLVRRLQYQHYIYHRTQEGSNVAWKAWLREYTPPLFNTSSSAGIQMLQTHLLSCLTKSLVYKAGNCDEMARLAVLRLSQLALDQLSPNEDFEVQAISLPHVDHLLARIRIKNEVALCDPWINFAEKIDFQTITQYLVMLYEALNPEQQAIFRKHQDRVRFSIRYEISHAFFHTPFDTIDTFRKAFHLVSSHQRFHDEYMKGWYSYVPSVRPGHPLPPTRDSWKHMQLMSEIKNPAHVKKCMTHLRDQRSVREQILKDIDDLLTEQPTTQAKL